MNVIIRRTKRTHPFVIIDKSPLENTKLSWQAKGLLVYLMSKPDDWQVRVEQLATVSRAFRSGADTVRASLKELQAAGHARLQPIPTGGKEWIIYEDPTCGSSRRGVEADVGLKPTSGPTGRLISNEPFTKERVFVRPTVAEVTAYAKDIGFVELNPEQFHAYYESNGWKVSGRAKMKDWKAAVRYWRGNKFQPRARQGGRTTDENHKTPYGKVDRNIGTANEGKSSQYEGVGRIKRFPDA